MTKKIITTALDTGGILVIQQQKSSQINKKNKSRQIMVIYQILYELTIENVVKISGNKVKYYT